LTEDRAIPTPAKKSLRPKSPLQLLSRAELLSVVPLSYASIWQQMRDGTFPKSRQIGKHKVAWIADEVATWIASRPAVKLKNTVILSKQPKRK
jgi:predicted DNA-binding transcriptional regulator AlpA